jgi:hypothetical protein
MNMANFTDYCISFYGPRGLYPMKMTEEEVSRAVRLSGDDWEPRGLMGIPSTGRRVRDVVRVMRGDKTSTNWEI